MGSSSCCACGCKGDSGSGWSDGSVETPSGSVPRVVTRWSWRDTLGAWAVCWGIGRMRYTVPPGLYAVGTPPSDAPLLVTANYKLFLEA